MNVPALVAHRGYPRRYPENSLPGIEAALKAGAPWVEVDVQMTRDGVPVLLHDVDLARTAGVEARILDLDYAEAAKLCVGEAARFGDEFAHVRLPSLEQLVELWRGGTDAKLFVELKGESLHQFGVDSVVRVVSGLLKPIETQCVLLSYDARVLPWAKRLHVAGSGWVVGKWDGAAHVMATELAPDYLFCNVDKVPHAPAALWPGPWEWVLYDVTDPQQALALADRGAGLVSTFAIGEMLADPLLGRR